MNLSKRQGAILWVTVIVVVLLLGMTSSIVEIQTKSESTDRTVRTQECTYIYGILISDKRITTENWNYVDDSFFYSIQKNKYPIILAVVLIGLTAIITSKKK